MTKFCRLAVFIDFIFLIFPLYPEDVPLLFMFKVQYTLKPLVSL